MRIFSRTIFHAHVDHKFHAEVTQDVVILCGWSCADEEVSGDEGEVHVGNGITGIKEANQKDSEFSESFYFFTFSLLLAELQIFGVYIFEQELYRVI